jgi:hypothetical protein
MREKLSRNLKEKQKGGTGPEKNEATNSFIQHVPSAKYSEEKK